MNAPFKLLVVAALILTLLLQTAEAKNNISEPQQLDDDPATTSTGLYFHNKLEGGMLMDDERRLQRDERLCHNVSGTCYFFPTGKPPATSVNATLRHTAIDHANSNGRVFFHCLSGGENQKWVPAAQRCDGHDDCADGSDEMYCQLPPEPLWDHKTIYAPNGSSTHRRHFAPLFSESTCINCYCEHGEVELRPDNNGQPHPWLKFALAAGPSIYMLSQPHYPPEVKDKPCSPDNTVGLTLMLFKKNKRCRGAVCCAKQLKCNYCLGTLEPRFKKCYNI